jgi:hypothetical protein
MKHSVAWIAGAVLFPPSVIASWLLLIDQNAPIRQWVEHSPFEGLLIYSLPIAGGIYGISKLAISPYVRGLLAFGYVPFMVVAIFMTAATVECALFDRCFSG